MGKLLKKSEDKNILVTGDFIVDRNLLPGNRKLAADQPDSGTRLLDHFGGSLLTFSLYNTINAEYGKNTLNCIFDLVESDLKQFISDYHERTAFSIWKKEKAAGAWSVEELKGYGYVVPRGENFPYKRKDLSVQSEWIIIDDGNLGFRNCEEAWPDFAGKKVILKCSYCGILNWGACGSISFTRYNSHGILKPPQIFRKCKSPQSPATGAGSATGLYAVNTWAPADVAEAVMTLASACAAAAPGMKSVARIHPAFLWLSTST